MMTSRKFRPYFGIAILLLFALSSCSPVGAEVTEREEAYPPPTPDFSTLPTAVVPEPIEFISEQGQFNIRFPCCDLARAALTQHNVTRQAFSETLQCEVAALGEDGASWKVEYCDLPPAVISTNSPHQVLDWARDDALARARAHLDQEAPITPSFELPVHARELLGQANMRGIAIDGTFKGRMYLTENRIYWVVARVYNENWGNRLAMMDPFLESFFLHSALTIPFDPTSTPP